MPASTVLDCTHAHAYLGAASLTHTPRMAGRPSRARVKSDTCACEILNNVHVKLVHDELEGKLRSKDGSFECIDVSSRMVNMWRAKFKLKDIVDRFAEGVKVSRTAVYNLLTKFRKTESIGDIERRPRSRRLSEEHYRFIDELMADYTDLTSRQPYSAFIEEYPTVEASLSTVKRAQRHLGWTAKRTRYCQLISEVNKEKRMEWCLDRVIAW